MDYKYLILNEEKNTCIVTLNRTQSLNALNREMVLEIGQAFTEIENRTDIRCVIINGEKNFAAGADIGDMADMTPEAAKAFAFGAIFDQVEKCSKPTIAAISGFALGAGMELPLACDLRIAAPDARMGFPEITLGIFPGAGGTQRLPKLIGNAQAKEMIYLGSTINAEKALAIGLINRIAEDPLAEAKKIAAKLVQLPPIALRSAKKCIDLASDMDANAGTQLELSLWGNLFSTYDQKEGMNAFLEKRKPNFIGK